MNYKLKEQLLKRKQFYIETLAKLQQSTDEEVNNPSIIFPDRLQELFYIERLESKISEINSFFTLEQELD